MKTMFKLLVVLALLAAALPAAADTILVLGRAPLGANEAAAKKAAVADALSRAVARAATTSLDPVTLRNNLAVLDQQVLSDAKRYITNYTLTASAPSGEDFLALVSVTIDQRALTRSLIRAALKLPTSHMGAVLVMVSEETAPGRPPVYWWSGLPGAPDAPAPLAKVIKRMGVRIVNPQPLKALLTPDMRQPVLSEAQALEFARQVGAQVVLLGSIRTYPLVTQEQVTPPPLVQLLAIDARSGQVMAIEELEGPAFHTTPPAEEYSKILGMVETSVRNLMAQLSAKLAEASAQSKEITLKVSGVRSLPQLMRLETALRSLPDLVEKVQRVSAGAGKATFAITLKGTPSQLADQLMVQDYGDFLVNVVEQDSRNVEAVIIPRQPGGAPAMAPKQPEAQYKTFKGAPSAAIGLGGKPESPQKGVQGAPSAAIGRTGESESQGKAIKGTPSAPGGTVTHPGSQDKPAGQQKFPWEQQQGQQPQTQPQQAAPQPDATPAPPAAQPATPSGQQKYPWEQQQGQQPQPQKKESATQPGTAPAKPAAPMKFPWEQNQNQAAPSAPAGASGQ